MPNRLLITRREEERRAALFVEGKLTELFVERVAETTVVGRIYKGRVVRVLPSLQAAFIDVGLARTAFLYVGDLQNSDRDGDASALAVGDGQSMHSYPPINTLIQQGQELMVQLTKEPIGSKGARVTNRVTLPGRFLVLNPASREINVSRRIEDEVERRRLVDLAKEIKPEEVGLIIRTAARGASKEDFADEVSSLNEVWRRVQGLYAQGSTPCCVHEDLDLTLRCLRDHMVTPGDEVIVDKEEEAARIRVFIERANACFQGNVSVHVGSESLFASYGVDAAINAMTRRKIWQKSGSYIVIDATEALTAIDVNTGKNVGCGDLEKTMLQVNLESAAEIAYQLRLRDIGGLIIIDFIDMENAENRQRVTDALKDTMAMDPARSMVLPMSRLGLVEMTRKRVRRPVTELLTEPCPCCDGSGRRRSAESTLSGLVTHLRRLISDGYQGALDVIAHPDLVSEIKADPDRFSVLEDELEGEIFLHEDRAIRCDAFRVQPKRPSTGQ